MKRYVLWLNLVFFLPLSAQKIKKTDLLQLEKQVFRHSLQNFDTDAAKNAAYRIIALEGKQTVYMDSLAYIYMNQNNFLSCLKVSNQILEQKEKFPILKLKAISLENLNAPKEAIVVYEKIFQQEQTPSVAYKLALLQYQIKRTAEAFATLKSVENKEFPTDMNILFTGPKKDQQQVPFKAAYYNLLAMISYDLHNYDESIAYFNKALEIFPDFYVAKQNKQAIEVMKKKLEDNKEPLKNNK